MSKKKIAILFGGQSAEHEVSTLSAKSVATYLDTSKFESTLIGISKTGKWYYLDRLDPLEKATIKAPVLLETEGQEVVLTPNGGKGRFISTKDGSPLTECDAIFPVLHGTFGEDGTVQGLIKLMGLPFVGPSVLGSSVSMDKDAMKKLLNQAGIPNAKYVTIHDYEADQFSYEELAKNLGSPFFLKPANLGSSVGVHKVSSKDEFEAAKKDAFLYDRKILIEEFIKGREIECSVLGNDFPEASLPGEIIPTHDFYSYEAKYVDEKGAELRIPADLDKKTQNSLQELAKKTFKTLYCEGLGRVDFFVTDDKKIMVNEINTLPGFTNISMYPKLWEATGLPYKDLISKLIDLAFDRHEKEARLKTDFK